MMRQGFPGGFGCGGGAAADNNSCRNCGVRERPLHELCHRGNFKKLCTSCVLRLNPQSFCPTCFAVYNNSSQNDVVTCVKCYSASHSQCVGNSHSNPYVCPICVSPNSPLFAPRKAKEANLNSKFENGYDCRVIDKKAARVFLAAAMIAAMSTSKAAFVARTVAEKRAEEAACMRKQAKEALEHLLNLAAMEDMRREEFSMVPYDVDRNRFGNFNRAETSSEVLTALNAVDLREMRNGNMIGVEENGGSSMASDLVQNHGGAMQIDVQNHVENRESSNGQGLRISSGAVPIPPVEDMNQRVQHIHAGEQINNGLKQ